MLPESFRDALLWAAPLVLAVGVVYLFLLSRQHIAPPDVSSEHAVTRRAARNSAMLLVTTLGDRVLFWGFWIVALRLLGPEGNGQYAFATNLLVYFAAATNFGLSTLVTREVARRPERVDELFGNALAIRLVLVAVAIPLMIAIAAVFWLAGSLSGVSLGVAAILAVSLVPHAINQSYASLYSAYEQMGFRGATVIGTALITISGGLLALLLDGGVVALAVVAIVAGSITFYTLARPLRFGRLLTIRRARRAESLAMLGTSLPLMLNELLASIFFQIDILVIQPLQGTALVGKYNSAYKFVAALSVVAPAVILPLFPALARAATGQGSLAPWIGRAWRPMILLAAPVVTIFVVFGHDIIGTFWGDAFLPEAGDVLVVLMWVLPFAYLNGLLQYVLISSDRLRSITVAFTLASTFNIALNLVLIPCVGVIGAAYATVTSELVLLGLYVLALRGGTLLLAPLLAAIRPVAGAALMLAPALLLRDAGWVLAAAAAGVAYLVFIVATRAVTGQDLAFARSALGRAAD
ncbi:MAG: flippase [Chloroflexota bacterium]|nr:flippase [Chloroflexota bacterium]